MRGSHGFTRTVYEDGYKYTMDYPPGWKQGDPRQPQVRKEPWVPGPPDSRIYSGRQSCLENASLAGQQLRIGSHQSASPGNGTGAAQEPSPESVRRAARKAAWSHPLRAYLAQAWLPKYVLGVHAALSVHYERSLLRVLARAPGTRQLCSVRRIFDWQLRQAFVSLKEALTDMRLTWTLVEQGKLSDLSLPDTACCVLDKTDGQFLDDYPIFGPSDVTRLLQAYPLCTVVKAMKLFLHLPDGHPACAGLKFEDVNHLCPARNADLFDLIGMPGVRPGELSLLIMVVSPRVIQYDDLEEFSGMNVPGGNIDLTDSASKPPRLADVLRAIIWDTCLEHNCRYFVLTTYDEWVFGTFSADMHCADVTTHLRAPVFPRDMTVSARDVAHPRFPAPNVFELLLLWIFAAADDPTHVWWPLPPDMNAHGLVHASMSSTPDVEWVRLETGT